MNRLYMAINSMAKATLCYQGKEGPSTLRLPNSGTPSSQRSLQQNAVSDLEANRNLTQTSPSPSLLPAPDLTQSITRIGLQPLAHGGYSTVWRGHLRNTINENTESVCHTNRLLIS